MVISLTEIEVGHWGWGGVTNSCFTTFILILEGSARMVSFLYRAVQSYGMKGFSKCSNILSRQGRKSEHLHQPISAVSFNEFGAALYIHQTSQLPLEFLWTTEQKKKSMTLISYHHTCDTNACLPGRVGSRIVPKIARFSDVFAWWLKEARFLQLARFFTTALKSPICCRKCNI